MADAVPVLCKGPGDSAARQAVYGLAFRQLRRIASALLRRERPGHTLQPTALVSEAFLKLRKVEVRLLDEDQFLRLSARAMRQVLIEHARGKKAVQKISLEMIPELLLPSSRDAGSSESSLAVRMVFEKLRALDATVAETVWLRSVEGLTIQELSLTQGREAWRVRADHDFGLQWMAGRLKHHGSVGRNS